MPYLTLGQPDNIRQELEDFGSNKGLYFRAPYILLPDLNRGYKTTFLMTNSWHKTQHQNCTSI